MTAAQLEKSTKVPDEHVLGFLTFLEERIKTALASPVTAEAELKKFRLQAAGISSIYSTEVSPAGQTGASTPNIAEKRLQIRQKANELLAILDAKIQELKESSQEIRPIAIIPRRVLPADFVTPTPYEQNDGRPILDTQLLEDIVSSPPKIAIDPVKPLRRLSWFSVEQRRKRKLGEKFAQIGEDLTYAIEPTLSGIVRIADSLKNLFLGKNEGGSRSSLRTPTIFDVDFNPPLFIPDREADQEVSAQLDSRLEMTNTSGIASKSKNHQSTIENNGLRQVDSTSSPADMSFLQTEGQIAQEVSELVNDLMEKLNNALHEVGRKRQADVNSVTPQQESRALKLLRQSLSLMSRKDLVTISRLATADLLIRLFQNINFRTLITHEKVIQLILAMFVR